MKVSGLLALIVGARVAIISLPGLEGRFLALCKAPGCRWTRYVRRIDRIHCCRDHGVTSSYRADVGRVTLVCPRCGAAYSFDYPHDAPPVLRCERHR